jgi:hypothetical protein
MNMNTTCLEATLEATADGIELTETSTVVERRGERRLISHILAWSMIGVMALSGLMWLSILLAAFVHFVSPAR